MRKSKHKNRKDHGKFPQPNRKGDKINYYVLKCRPVISRSSPQIHNSHLQVLLEIDSGKRYWMTINIRSGQDRVYYYLDDDYQHPITEKILEADLHQGFTKLESIEGGIALDYIRQELFDFAQMDVLGDGENDKFDSLEQMLTNQIVNAFKFDDARLFVYGSKFDHGEKFSSYDLAIGIHDIHMNQGSRGEHASSNGIYQDGALLIYYPTEKRWAATFLKFETQSTNTDENGN